MPFLQIFRGALLGGGGLALGNSIALSYGGGHKMTTYVAWYASAALLLVAGVGFWAVIHRRQSFGSTSDPCGDPKLRLRLMANGAEQLAYNLAHFEDWWPAVKDKDFDGRLPTKEGKEGHRTTHAQAMQTLLHRFAQFFSAAYTYQKQCHRHRPLKSMQKVYLALGDDPDGPTDYALKSSELQVLAVRSTPGWGTVEARPIELAEFQIPIENDPLFVEDFKTLREFLLAAGPDTEARARLEAVGEAVRRVEERLTKNALQRAFRGLLRLWLWAKSKVGISREQTP